jgi:hypothetical protein
MWSDVMTTMLRYMINDYGSPQVYTDNVLQTMLLINAAYEVQELNFSQVFTVDIPNLSINPDPIDNNPKDYNLVNLTVLRTAVMVAMNEYKASTINAIFFKEFHSQADMRGIAPAKKALWEELQKLYDEKRLHYQIGIRVSGQAILSPVNIIAGGWRGPIYVYSDRDRFVI